MHLRYGFTTGEVWKMAEKAHIKYGPIVRLGPRQVWISDKDSLKQILSIIDLPKVAMYAEISRDRYNPGLFGEIRPEPHRILKKFLSPAFTVAYVDKLIFLFSQCIEDLLQKYQTAIDCSYEKDKGIESDLMEDFHNLALDIMGECVFGKGFGQTNPKKEAESGIDDQIWKAIPQAIFDGLARRYQVSKSCIYAHSLTILRMSTSNASFVPSASTSKSIGPPKWSQLSTESCNAAKKSTWARALTSCNT